MRVGRADAERKDFDKKFKVELDSVIADNDKFSKAQKLQGITIPAGIKELELKRDSVSNQYAKQRYQKEIDEANEVNKRLDKFFSKSANASTKNYNNVTEY